ncbi:MAG: TRAP transporter permease, partial [Woeseiaceae bacterium]
MRATVIKWLAVAFALFHVYNNWFTAVSELWFAAIHFGGFGALCALAWHRADDESARHAWRDGFGILFALLSISIPVYFILFEDALYVREAEFIFSDYVFAAMAVLLAMEFTR